MGIYKPGRPVKFNPSTGKGTYPGHEPGEYRIRNPKGEIVYIGETGDLRRRTGEHMRTGKLPRSDGSTIEFKTADKRSSSRTRREHEQLKIERHKPANNRSVGGEGRIMRRNRRGA